MAPPTPPLPGRMTMASGIVVEATPLELNESHRRRVESLPRLPLGFCDDRVIPKLRLDQVPDLGVGERLCRIEACWLSCVRLFAPSHAARRSRPSSLQSDLATG